MPIIISKDDGAVNEKSTSRMRFTLVDWAGNYIPQAALTSATMQIIERDTETVIRASLDVKTNIDAFGVFTFYLQPSDNAFVNPASRQWEHHVAIFTFVGTSGGEAVTYNESFEWAIQNIRKIS